MSSTTRIADCIAHHEQYVQLLATLPDARLCDKLEAIHLQSMIAERTGNSDAIELLELWRAQVIEARTYKAEQGIADAPDEIKEVNASIETYIPLPDTTPTPPQVDTPRRLSTTTPIDPHDQLAMF